MKVIRSADPRNFARHSGSRRESVDTGRAGGRGQIAMEAVAAVRPVSAPGSTASPCDQFGAGLLNEPCCPGCVGAAANTARPRNPMPAIPRHALFPVGIQRASGVPRPLQGRIGGSSPVLRRAGTIPSYEPTCLGWERVCVPINAVTYNSFGPCWRAALLGVPSECGPVPYYLETPPGECQRVNPHYIDCFIAAITAPGNHDCALKARFLGYDVVVAVLVEAMFDSLIGGCGHTSIPVPPVATTSVDICWDQCINDRTRRRHYEEHGGGELSPIRHGPPRPIIAPTPTGPARRFFQRHFPGVRPPPFLP